MTAFLNSRLFKFAFKDYFPELLGDTLELRKVFFENVTAREANNDILIEEKLDLIQKYMSSGLSTIQLQNDIDEMIFDIYELTSFERSIILERSTISMSWERSINTISCSDSE